MVDLVSKAIRVFPSGVCLPPLLSRATSCETPAMKASKMSLSFKREDLHQDKL